MPTGGKKRKGGKEPESDGQTKTTPTYESVLQTDTTSTPGPAVNRNGPDKKGNAERKPKGE